MEDLSGLARLGHVGDREAERLRAAIGQTFALRKTHPVPPQLPDPPASWERPYAQLAEEDALPWRTLLAVIESARAFLDPVLRGDGVKRWPPARWSRA